jgi:hypothetical protein
LRPPRFLQATVSMPLGFDITQIDRVIDSESYDWLRYTLGAYLLWSSSDTETIVRKLLRIPGLLPTTVIFISAITKNDGFGYLPPMCWDWLRRDRGYGELALWHPPQIPELPE